MVWSLLLKFGIVLQVFYSFVSICFFLVGVQWQACFIVQFSKDTLHADIERGLLENWPGEALTLGTFVFELNIQGVCSCAGLVDNVLIFLAIC